MSGLWQAILRRAAKEHLRRHERAGRTPTIRAVFLGDFVSNSVVLDGIYEGRELDALAREVFPSLPRDSTALDIGANIGNHTVFFARYFSRVVAFEPNPMVAAILRVNTAGLGSSVEVVPLGLSDASTRLNFKTHDHNLGGSRIADEATGMTVDVKALDEVIRDSELRFDNVSFIKIDVEGHEDKVIAGACDLLSTTYPVIALEGFYKADPKRGTRVCDLLDDLGYQNFYRLSDRRTGESRAIYSVTPKLLKRRRRLSLEQIDGLIGEDHNLVIASVGAI